jgi:membrane-bound lytic murein transglycosylase D
MNPIKSLMRLSFCGLLCGILLVLSLMPGGCVTQQSRIQSAPPPVSEQAPPKQMAPGPVEAKKEASAPETETAPEQAPARPLPGETKSAQEKLDSALEFCQASYDYWEQGDLENALAALDQAYSLVLQIETDEDPEILQQRDDLRVTISKRIIEVYASRFTVANGINKVIPLEMNRHVERAVKLFQGKEKDFFLGAYRRSGRYRPAIIRALKEAGLPEELSWLPLIESGFKVRALSRARALGLWQFIASTGYKYGLKRDQWTDERMDPEKATRAAIGYLRELHQIFGDWTTALAAYNCGEARVLRCIRTQKINYLDNFWDLYEKLPFETAFYVPKFLAVLHIINDPDFYGFSLPPVDPPQAYERVTINKPVHLRTVAKSLDTSYMDLKALNPELRHASTPNRPYVLKVPDGKGDLLLSRIHHIPAWRPPTPAYVVHRVRRGESLSVIARRYRTSVRAIMAMNGLRNSHLIRAGARLKIPTRHRVAAAPSSKGGTGSPLPGKRVKYVVQKGDSLWKLANQFGTTTKAIQSRNNLVNSHLRIGQVLMIPTGEPPAYAEISTKEYKVKKGDSPYLIARRHRMNLSDFLRLNRLTPRSTIFPGQVLLVKAD